MKNSLPFLLAADLLIPFLLAPTYKGYSHLTKVMSVLGNSKAPLHFVYNIWLVVFGIYFLFSAVRLYPVVAKTSSVIAVLLFFGYCSLRHRRLYCIRLVFRRGNKKS